jgi:hypothetical protein
MVGKIYGVTLAGARDHADAILVNADGALGKGVPDTFPRGD